MFGHFRFWHITPAYVQYGIVVTVTNSVVGALNELCGLYSLLYYRDDIISGSGSIVAYNEKFYLLSCCHNFLTRDHACRLGKLKDDNVKQEIKRNCKKAQFHFSTKDFKSTVPVSADVVLKNCEDPVLVFDKVGTIGHHFKLCS